MRKKGLNAAEVFFLLTILPSLALGYSLFISDNLDTSISIFDASIGREGCRYRLENHWSSETPPSVIVTLTENGVVQATRNDPFSPPLGRKSICMFTVIVDSCIDFTRVEIPVAAYFLFDNHWKWSSTEMLQYITEMPPMNVSVRFSSENSKRSSEWWTKVLPYTPTSVIFPSSLQQCSVNLHLVKKSKNSNFKLHHKALYASTESLFEKQLLNAHFSYLVHHCILDEIGFVELANDRMKINVKIMTGSTPEISPSVLITNSQNMEAELLEEPYTISRRKKRSARPVLYFRQSVRRETILENSAPNTEVLRLEVYNPSSLKLHFTWHSTSDKRSLNMFSLDSQTGVITTRVILDREAMSSHSFRVIVTGDSTSADCNLVIIVKDMNDNVPRFEEQIYNFKLKENEMVGAYVGQVTASDNDDGRNAIISYSIQGLAPNDQVFDVSQDGEITLKRKIDREVKSLYTFRVVAADDGETPQRSTAQVRVVVDDINDNSPRFRESAYRVQISENTKRNSKIFTVSAEDIDAGRNGQVTYSLPNGNDQRIFAIGRESGEITVISDINFENNPNGFNLRVRAQDGGRPPRSGFCVVTVSLVDVNDNTPTFLSSPYVVVLYEDLRVGSAVIRVEAVDADSGDNARLTYSFIPPPSNIPFRINNTSGEIFLSRRLDFETSNRYSLTVRATDHGAPPKWSNTKVDVTIRDINDNAPKFTQPIYNVRVAEDMRVGKEVITIRATDGDRNTDLNYRIISGNNFNKFGISTRSNEGVITLKQTLDFNQKGKYILTILCTDGTHTSTAKVYINVTDANTNAPEFVKASYEVNIPEDIRIGTTVLQVKAQDRDVGENARITYSFQEPSRYSWFDLDIVFIYYIYLTSHCVSLMDLNCQ